MAEVNTIEYDASGFHGGLLEPGGQDIVVRGLDQEGFRFVEDEILYFLATHYRRLGEAVVKDQAPLSPDIADVLRHTEQQKQNRIFRWARLSDGTATIAKIGRTVDVGWHAVLSRTGYTHIADARSDTVYSITKRRHVREVLGTIITPTLKYQTMIERSAKADPSVTTRD